MSLICSCAGGVDEGQRLGVAAARAIAPTITCVVRVPCLSSSRAPGAQRLLGEPAQGGVELVGHPRRGGGGGEQVAAGDVDVVGEQHRHAAARAGRRPAARPRCRPRRRCVRAPPRQHHDLVARRARCPRDLAGVAAVVVQLVRPAASCGAGSRTAPASGTARSTSGPGDRHRLQVPEQRRAVVPGGVLASARRRCRRPAPRPGSSRRRRPGSPATGPARRSPWRSR